MTRRAIVRWVSAYVAVVAALICCTKRTTVVGPPADPFGQYAVSWSSGLDGVALITLDGIRFISYPCAITTDISGVYSYDPGTGEFLADLKTIGGGDAHLVMAGLFEGRRMTGSYTVALNGVRCNKGNLVLEPTP